MKYEMFTDMSFSQGYYFIYFNKDECLFIPQTAFADETQKRAFFDILSQKTGIDTSALVS